MPIWSRHAEGDPPVPIGRVERDQPQTERPPRFIEGSVRRGTPVAGALVDIGHADDEGFSDVQKNPALPNGRAAVRSTEADGCFLVLGAAPAVHSNPSDGTVGGMLKAQARHPHRPARVHLMIAAPGCETPSCWPTRGVPRDRQGRRHLRQRHGAGAAPPRPAASTTPTAPRLRSAGLIVLDTVPGLDMRTLAAHGAGFRGSGLNGSAGHCADHI